MIYFIGKMHRNVFKKHDLIFISGLTFSKVQCSRTCTQKNSYRRCSNCSLGVNKCLGVYYFTHANAYFTLLTVRFADLDVTL